MTRAAVILAVVSALCLGVALGFMGGVMFSHHMQRGGGMGFNLHGGPMAGIAPQGPRGMPSPRTILPRLKRLLDLTPQQSEAIRGEIERSRGDFAGVRDSLHTRIERHLTPEQRDRWRRATRDHGPGNGRSRFEHGGFDPHPSGDEPGTQGEDRR